MDVCDFYFRWVEECQDDHCAGFCYLLHVSINISIINFALVEGIHEKSFYVSRMLNESVLVQFGTNHGCT